MKKKLSQTPSGIDWLKQFEVLDQKCAISLLDAMKFVSHEEMCTELRSLILERSKLYDSPIALYAEREIGSRGGIPHRLFKEKKGRAFGIGPRPIQPLRYVEPDIGSEALIAFLITQMCRENKTKFLNHPGPDEIRRKKPHAFFLVTDLIASGSRVSKYLSAIWVSKSVKSWHSLGLFQFEVVSYSSTDSGKQLVLSNPSNPKVNFAFPCPTIGNSFNSEKRLLVKNLCVKYDPYRGSRKLGQEALGYGNIGALLAFWHGCPNNAPNILHKKRGNWSPLFPSRVTTKQQDVYRISPELIEIVKHIQDLGMPNISDELIAKKSKKELIMLLILLCLRNKRRSETLIALRSGLSILEVRVIIKKAQQLGWVSANSRLTDEGYKQLRSFKKANPKKSSEEENKILYFPTMLRAPIASSHC